MREEFNEPYKEFPEEESHPGCCSFGPVSRLPNVEVSPCLIYGCKNLQTICTQCGRIINTTTLG